MKICKIIIFDYYQFKDFELDLTYPKGHPKSDQPLEKICLIGRNGTGKTNLLELLYKLLNQIHGRQTIHLILKIFIDNQYIYVTYSQKYGTVECYTSKIDEIDGWKDKFKQSDYKDFDKFRINANNEILNSLILKHSHTDTLIYSPSEGSQNLYKQISDVPHAVVSDALNLFKTFPFDHYITSDTVSDFWKTLIFLIKKRESDWLDFELQPENQSKVIGELRREFDENNPHILEKLSELWNKILDKAGLEFDYRGASKPIQLGDNLRAYINLKKSPKIIPYSQLSTGIRNFIFKVGHIYSLYFNRNIERGFLLIDEPENSLFPDFLYDLIHIYTSIIVNTQLIVATHSPIIAAQFESYERIILDFNDDGSISSRKGVAPIGDDPNDLLIKDFGIRSLLGKEGIEKWERFIELKVLIKKEDDELKKISLIEEYMQIGTKYNFPGNEVFAKG